MRTEVEVLTPLLETKRSALKKLARFEMASRQRTCDIYLFDPLCDDLKPEPSSRIRRCFRVRTDGETGIVTYKIDHFGADDEWRYSDGAGFRVSNFDSAVEIFHQLGFTTLCEIRSEKISFSEGHYTLVLEDVVDLGLFSRSRTIALAMAEKRGLMRRKNASERTWPGWASSLDRRSMLENQR